mmetsp:Transcript_104454/g.185790  ORF Transcript_104454/g.185790 Transcript_104454/m.185790 type:complete len:235 (-) Transcript_104454:265-969(-)
MTVPRKYAYFKRSNTLRLLLLRRTAPFQYAASFTRRARKAGSRIRSFSSRASASDSCSDCACTRSRLCRCCAARSSRNSQTRPNQSSFSLSPLSSIFGSRLSSFTAYSGRNNKVFSTRVGSSGLLMGVSFEITVFPLARVAMTGGPETGFSASNLAVAFVTMGAAATAAGVSICAETCLAEALMTTLGRLGVGATQELLKRTGGPGFPYICVGAGRAKAGMGAGSPEVVRGAAP